MRHILSTARGSTEERMPNGTPSVQNRDDDAEGSQVAVFDGCEYKTLWTFFLNKK